MPFFFFFFNVNDSLLNLISISKLLWSYWKCMNSCVPFCQYKCSFPYWAFIRCFLGSWLTWLAEDTWLWFVFPSVLFYNNLFLNNCVAKAGPKSDLIFPLLCSSRSTCFVHLLYSDSVVPPLNHDSFLTCEHFSEITTLQMTLRSGFPFCQTVW